jgi:CPA2 family monovalent cation:H+ antiporter-2
VVELDYLLKDAVILLGSAVAVLLITARLRVPPVVALLLTGLLVGPSGFGWIADSEEVEVFAEIGVVFLLFIIGLELSLDLLRELRRPFLIGGSVQAAVTASIASGVGLALGFDLNHAIFLGFVIALSSTAIVLKLYSDQRETDTPHGRTVLGILLFQDFLIVPMIVLIPVLAGEVQASSLDLLLRFAGAVAAIVAIVVVARKIAPKLFDRIARTRIRETFVLGSLGICLALAWLTHTLGLSLALGAFVAGLLVTETEYGHQAIADVAPFRDLFASLFFISVGMLVDIEFAAAHLPTILALAVAVVIVKSLVASGAAAAVGMPARVQILVGFALAQVGEFSFLLMEVGREHALLEPETYQLLLSTVVLTMLATPLLIRLGPSASNHWVRMRGAPASHGLDDAASALSGHVILLGFGAGGQLLARVFREARVDYVVVELNTETVKRARREGEPIFYGDATRRAVLEHAGIEHARVVVFAMSDAAAVRRAVRASRDLNPAVEIIVRSRRIQEIEGLRSLGANDVVAEEFETAIEIFTRVLHRYHVPRNVIRAQIRVLRGEGYRMLRSPEGGKAVSAAVLDALEAGTTDIFRIERGSPVAGQSLRDLDLRRQTGATVLAVVRDEEPDPNPGGDTVLEAGDDLVLVGSHAEIDQAFVVLDGLESNTGRAGPDVNQ